MFPVIFLPIFYSLSPMKHLSKYISRHIHFLSPVGAQGRPPPNMTLWHIDEFEVELLKWQLVQRHLKPPLSPYIQEINVTCERCPSYT